MKKFTAFAIFLLICSPLFSDLYNNRNQLIGERAALMGGAFTALANDLSGTFYNPAGVAKMGKPAVSLSATAYRFLNTTRYEKELSAITPVKVDSFSPAPTSFGICHFLSKDIVAAFSVYQIDSYAFSAISFFPNGSVTLDLETETTLIGTTFSARLSDSISVGASVFLHLFNGKTRTDESFILNVTNHQIGTQNQELTSTGILPVVGIRWDISKSFRAGASFTLETIPISGKSKVSVNSVDQIGGSVLANAETDSESRLPSKLALGLAYEKKDSLTIAIDFIYYFSLSYSAPYDILKQKQPTSYHKEDAHFDLSIGCEIYLSKSFSLRFGLFSNSSGATDQDEDMRINMYGGSFGIGFIKNGLSTGIGVIISKGDSNWGYGGTPGKEVSWDRAQFHIVVGSSSTF